MIISTRPIGRENRKTYEDNNTLHIVLPGLDQCLIVAFRLSYIDRPKLGGSLVVFFSIMDFTLIADDNGLLVWMSITFDGHCLGHYRCGFLRAILFPSIFKQALKYDYSLKLE